MEQIHATAIDIDGNGVLLLGPSASGKSDLALRLIDDGARLVADDRVDLCLIDGRLMASAPAELAGKLEVRGLGIQPMDAVPKTAIALAVELVALNEIERVPEPAVREFLRLSIPLVRLYGLEASAPAKVRVALKATTGL
ncbi:MAG: aldolase [Rhodospirillales bacterium]|nr:aldolase [Rhodospirillales bacterium]